MESRAKLKARAEAINDELRRMYPDARCSLNFRNPYELLVATILSAQCTDERVNIVTPGLFKKYPSPAKLAAALPEDLEKDIQSTGFFRNKTKSLKGMSAALVEQHSGKVPSTMEQLNKLPGVGRKTANVVLGNCFNTPGITVDTHVNRVTQRLGLTTNTEPDKIEQDLMEVIPQADWTNFSHRVIEHGRAICQARRPLCEQCALRPLCRYYQLMSTSNSPIAAKMSLPKKATHPPRDATQEIAYSSMSFSSFVHCPSGPWQFMQVMPRICRLKFVKQSD